MIDTEVLRLRQLRNTALQARAVAQAFGLSRGALACWRIARVVTGTLRAHPHQGYQQGPSELRTLHARGVARLLGLVCRDQSHRLRAVSAQLQRVARELDDARALTWSQDLSEALGRSQLGIRVLIKELNAVARAEDRSANSKAGSRVDARSGDAVGHGASVAAAWPYLAFKPQFLLRAYGAYSRAGQCGPPGRAMCPSSALFPAPRSRRASTARSR